MDKCCLTIDICWFLFFTDNFLSIFYGGIMNNNNMDISKLMNALSNMDKKDLEKGIAQLNNVLNSNDKQKIIEQLKNNMNK